MTTDTPRTSRCVSILGLLLCLGAHALAQSAVPGADIYRGTAGATTSQPFPRGQTAAALDADGAAGGRVVSTPQAATTAQGAEATLTDEASPVQPAPPSALEATYAALLPLDSPPLTQFGYTFFQRKGEPSFTSVGDGYVVGPGDVLFVYIWGDSVDVAGLSPTYELTVDRDGMCFFPPVGGFSAWGMTLKSIKEYMVTALSRKYRRFELSLTSGKLRSFPVYVTGFVTSPGPVMATAVDSVLDAVSRAGGVDKAGSLRQIVHTRGDSKTVIDLYQALVNGASTDIQVREGDTVFVPAIGPVAAAAGAVKRPAIYELREEKTVADVLELAGGLLPSAHVARIGVVRTVSGQRVLIDGSTSQADARSLEAKDGDLIRVEAAKDYVANEVEIAGRVLFPGSYSTERTPTLRGLLDRAQLLPDANRHYGRIYRIDESGYSRNMTFAPSEILAGVLDVPLSGQDRIVISALGQDLSEADFDQFPHTVSVSGPVRYPGLFAWRSGMRLSSILSGDTFLLDTNVQYAEILRRQIGSDARSIVSFSPIDVAGGRGDLDLMALDSIRFFPRTLDDPIEVSGAVEESRIILYYPGIDLLDVLRIVTLQGDPLRVKAYVYREGTLRAAGASPLTGGAPSTVEAVRAGSEELGAPTDEGRTPAQQTRYTLYLNDFLGKQGITEFPLKPGDRIVFAEVLPNEKNPQVTVRGQVNQPGAFLFQPGMRLSDALRSAGGFALDAYAKGLVLLRQSTAQLQRQQLDRAAKTLELALQQNVVQSAATLSSAASSDAQLVALQIQAQRAQLEALRSQIADVLGRISIRMPETIDELVGSPEDLLLDEADSIFVPRTPTFVQLIGEVFNPITAAFRPGLRVRDYVLQAGGTTRTADLSATYLIRADGTVVSPEQRRFLFFPGRILNDMVLPGDTIVVAKKEPATPVLPVISDVVGIISGLSASAASTYAIIRALLPTTDSR